MLQAKLNDSCPDVPYDVSTLVSNMSPAQISQECLKLILCMLTNVS